MSRRVGETTQSIEHTSVVGPPSGRAVVYSPQVGQVGALAGPSTIVELSSVSGTTSSRQAEHHVLSDVALLARRGAPNARLSKSMERIQSTATSAQ